MVTAAKWAEALRILGLCVAASVAFGIVHDLFTVSVCVEYFTVHHPPVFRTDNRLLLALAWGIFATWWVGAGLGILLGLVATFGRRPVFRAKRLFWPLVRLLGAILAVSLLTWVAVRYGLAMVFPTQMATAEEYDIRVMASAMMHGSSYFLGGVGGLALAVWVSRMRRRLGHEPLPGP